MAKASVAKAVKSASGKKTAGGINIESISSDIESALWIVRSVLLELREEEQVRAGALYCASLENAGTLLDRANGKLTGSEPSCVGTFDDWLRWPGSQAERDTQAQEVANG